MWGDYLVVLNLVSRRAFGLQTSGPGNWTSVPKKAGLERCGKSCRLRWTNYLRPDLNHDNFTPEEEELIVNLHQAIGSRWSHIAMQLPGRTDNDVKNHWNTKLKKKLFNMGIDPVTHKPCSSYRWSEFLVLPTVPVVPVQSTMPCSSYRWSEFLVEDAFLLSTQQNLEYGFSSTDSSSQIITPNELSSAGRDTNQNYNIKQEHEGIAVYPVTNVGESSEASSLNEKKSFIEALLDLDKPFGGTILISTLRLSLSF